MKVVFASVVFKDSVNMDFLTIILVAVGLSFDTFAVSVSNGLSITSLSFRQAIKIAFILAFFQALMPFLGWFMGIQVEQFVSEYDHWIAFGLLLLLGMKMIIESIKKTNRQKDAEFPKLTIIIGMAIATSIDALVVGISFAFVKINIYYAVAIVGLVTFLVSMIGLLFGKTLGRKLGREIEVFGGIILIAIGIKILLSHV